MSDAAKPRLKVSREGVVLIKSFEGFRPHAVKAGDGWRIGYGHTASAREGATVTESEAELLLQYDLAPVVRALNERITAPLNQHQFDALASFALSLGVERFMVSEVVRRLNAGIADPADALLDAPAAVAADAGLHRRAAERALFTADPAQPTLLADLLIAPVSTQPLGRSQAAVAAEARAAAVATLLGEADGLAPFPAAAEPDTSGEDWKTPLESDPPAKPPVAEPSPEDATPLLAHPTVEPDPAPVETPPTVPEEPAVKPVIRHEVFELTPHRFDWSETGMYIIMGVLGLIACAFAAAATRLTLLRPSPGGESGAIAWALAIIGVMCVGVSAWNLYVQWGRRR